MPWLNTTFGWNTKRVRDNATADALSRITTHLPLEAVQAVLDGVAMGTPQQAEVENPAVVEHNQHLGQEICVAAR